MLSRYVRIMMPVENVGQNSIGIVIEIFTCRLINLMHDAMLKIISAIPRCWIKGEQHRPDDDAILTMNIREFFLTKALPEAGAKYCHADQKNFWQRQQF